MHQGPPAHDQTKIEAAAVAWLTELGIERVTELTAVEQVELLVWGGHLSGDEWTTRSLEAIGETWDGVGPAPRWSRLGQARRKKRR